ncbi:MAG: universal stress protein [Anaerolineae bacterium]|nr:universal stress protein [Anaerolineae bacterium]
MIYKNILVPLDGSELAERVVPAAVSLAEAMAGSVTLLTVVAKKPGADVNLVAKAIQTGQFEADLYLRSVRKRFLPSLVGIETAVVTGKPDKAIIEYAREHAIDLIIMSTHGRSGITRWSFGRTADKVLRRSPCPTVILRSEHVIKPDQFKRILLPLDGSRLAERVLEPAMEMVKAIGVELFLLQVVEKGSFYGFGHDEAHVDEEVDAAITYLAELRERAIPPEVTVHTHAAVGSAADVIVDYAAEQAIDLILVSSRGNSGFDSWMFGSVAEKVMKGAPCAILVIRQEPFV